MASDQMSERAGSPQARLSRRRLLGAAGVLAAGATGYAVRGGGSAEPRRQPAVAAPPRFRGPHQPGVATPAQTHLTLAAFDLATEQPGELRRLLSTWSETADRLMRGGAGGLDPAGLTVTIGLGRTVFERDGRDRLGLRSELPGALAPLPRFAGEELDPERSDGDLCLQLCGDHPQVIFGALHTLTREAADVAVPRWTQSGFRAPASGGTPRNVMGFKDGTVNPGGAELDRQVWAAAGPAWMRGGTYMVVRRIRILLDVWDATSVEQQEAAVGRRKTSGAPIGGRSERDRVDLAALAPDAHVRLAAAATNGGAQLLRRGYNYLDGVDAATGQLDAGLVFIAFQADPHTQFVPIQRRLAAQDALNKHIQHTAGATFAVPPAGGAFAGAGLFARL
jgi:deferrochelatase/peroxidase EfeB